MKIALLNAFPNLRHSAEKEFIRRCLIVLKKLGHEATEVATSDEIIAFDPTVVVVTHEFVAKTTQHYTIGFLWSPTQCYRDEPERVKAIRSWDLVVPINAATRRFARDVHFPMRHMSAVSDLFFYPSAPITDVPLSNPAELSLAYVGVHWDGNRHNQLFRVLSEAVDLHVYGPPKAWEFLPNHYRGSLPFDGASVIKTLNRHGAVLATHNSAHIEEDTPSMRVFEACAAKCLVITDPLPTLVEIFGDSLSYIDVARSPTVIAREIAEIIALHKRTPALHTSMVRRASDAFDSKASLEKLLSALLEDVAERIRPTKAVNNAEQSNVTVIVRCGSRPLSMVQRAVSSLSKQTYWRIGIVFARYAEINGFSAWLAELRQEGRFLFLTDLAAPGGGVRSRTMWAGLRAVETELFCMLDDDDELFPNHISDLAETLRKNENASVAYSGVVRQEEDGILLNNHVRFKGDVGMEIQERRALHFLDDFNLDRLLKFDNYIQSNSWLARRHVLTPDVLDDPELEVAEDMYFYLLLASRYEFAFAGTASALWNWRSLANDNSMTAISPHHWAINGERLVRRLSQVSFPGGFLGKDVLGCGRLVDGRENSQDHAAVSEVQPLPEQHREGDAVRLPQNSSLSPIPDALHVDRVVDHPEPASDMQNDVFLSVRRGGGRFRPLDFYSLIFQLIKLSGSVLAAFAHRLLENFGISGERTQPRYSDARDGLGLEQRTNHLEGIEDDVYEQQDAGYAIDFSARRLPYFVADAHGLSHPESWGRWTVGSSLLLKFRRPLPRAFTLRIHGRAFESNHQQSIAIVVGQTAISLVMSSAPDTTYQADIVNNDLADSILFLIPNPAAPSKLWPGRSDDNRKLGIALVRLELIETETERPEREGQ